MSAAKEASPIEKEDEDLTCYSEYRSLDKQEHEVSQGNEKKKSWCSLSIGDKVEKG